MISPVVSSFPLGARKRNLLPKGKPDKAGESYFQEISTAVQGQTQFWVLVRQWLLWWRSQHWREIPFCHFL